MFSTTAADASLEAVDAETMHAFRMHLGDVPRGAMAATTQEAPSTPAGLKGTSSSAFLSSAFSGVTSGYSKDDAGADDEIPEYALPDAQYIERTILPLLLRGLEVVAQARPPDPLAFLGAYMICNNPQKPSSKNAPASANSLEKAKPTCVSAPADDSASPALAEAVKQAMSRFSASKSNTSAASKPTTAASAKLKKSPRLLGWSVLSLFLLVFTEMSFTDAQSPEYQRGINDAERHRRATEENWIRPALGPIVWLGVPFLLAWMYMRRVSLGSPLGSGSASGSGNPFMSMMEQMMPIKKRQFRVDVKGTRFSDVVGIPEAKAEVRQYVDFLTEPNKFTRLGARLPKGCLLTGEPGTGKTLLAKAVAGEANVAFFSCNGADFIELIGGSGPKRVRELFEEARAAAPAIIFIDEIDAIGSRAGKQGGSVSSEENRTINQLLAELDGLSTSADPIVVLAATNFQDNIDKALLREGRFDRKIAIEMPDLSARRELFEHYLNRICTGDPNGRTKDEGGKELALDTSVSNKALADQLADLTPGLSPATVATVVNEAALQSGIAGKPLVQLPDLLEALDNTLMGRKHRNRQSDQSARRTAIHEAGHALTAWMLPVVQKVLKISVTPRGHAMGYTQRAGTEFHEYQTNATLFADMVVMLGGRAAEEVMLGDVSAGAMDDLQRATDVALKQMLAFGMSTHTGLLSYHPDYTQAGRDFTTFSNEAQYRAELEAQKLLAAAHSTAVDIVKRHKDKMEIMVKALLEKKELSTRDIEELWGPRPSTPTVEDIVHKVIEVTGSYAEITATVGPAAAAVATPSIAGVY